MRRRIAIARVRKSAWSSAITRRCGRTLSWAKVFSIEGTVHHILPSDGDELNDQIPTSCELGKRSTAYAKSEVGSVTRLWASPVRWGRASSALIAAAV